MKKIFLFLILACFLVPTITMAGDAEVKVPTVQAGNVIVPQGLITTIPNWEKGKVVAAFHDVVGKKSRVPMQRVGNNWIIPGGAGADVHPVIVINGKDNWCKLELIWSMSSDFIKYRPAGPCLHVE